MEKKASPNLLTLNHCMIVQNYYPFAEVRVRREVDALLNAGHVVDVICLRHGSEPMEEFVDGVHIHRVAIGKKSWGIMPQLFDYLAFAFLAFCKVTRLHFRKRFDVVQAHNLPDFLVFAAIIPRLTGSRIILDIHDLMPEFYCSRFGKTMDSWPVRILCWQEYLACMFAHRVITVTDLWKDTLVKRGVPNEKCFVLMNLADPMYFNQGSSESKAEKRRPSFGLIYHGTIARRYGVDLFLEALKLVVTEIPDIFVQIHGRGDYLDAVRQLVTQLGLARYVNVTTDFLSPEDLVKLIRTFDAGVVPYRRDIFTDGILPTKLLEYVAVGIPAIVARTPVISSYFDDDSVEYFAAGDAADLAKHILLIHKDPKRRERLVSNSQRFNSRYSWPSQRAAYVDLVQHAAGRWEASGRTVTPVARDNN